MNNEAFIPNVAPEQRRHSKDFISRLKHYVLWLNMMGLSWVDADINEYIEYLTKLGTLRPATIRARISAVRTRYKMLQHTDIDIAVLLSGDSVDKSVDKDEIFKTLERAKLAPRQHYIPINYLTFKRSYIQLTTIQASQFLNMPDPHTLRGLRDKALIALLMATGLRESEVSLLTVDNLKLNGEESEVGVHVREGPASTKRFVPFYEDLPVQYILQPWLSQANIQEGPIFRGFYRNGKSVRDTAITLQAVEDIFAFYPITEGEKSVYLKPIDMRVFYAQLLYKLDYDLDTISQNLGVHVQTAVNYIGTPSKHLDKVPEFIPPK